MGCLMSAVLLFCGARDVLEFRSQRIQNKDPSQELREASDVVSFVLLILFGCFIAVAGGLALIGRVLGEDRCCGCGYCLKNKEYVSTLNFADSFRLFLQVPQQ